MLYSQLTCGERTSYTMENEKQTKTVSLSTFLSYKVEDTIGFKTISKDHKEIVNFMWCKICTKYKDQLKNSSLVKGSAKKSLLAFMEGTRNISHHQVNISY